MTEHTTTDCLLFPDIFDRPVVAKFDQRQGSSDGGAVLLKAANQRLGLTSALAGCLKEERQPGKINCVGSTMAWAVREEVTGLDLDKRQFASATVLLFGAPDFMIFVVHFHPST